MELVVASQTIIFEQHDLSLLGQDEEMELDLIPARRQDGIRDDAEKIRIWETLVAQRFPILFIEGGPVINCILDERIVFRAMFLSPNGFADCKAQITVVREEVIGFATGQVGVFRLVAKQGPAVNRSYPKGRRGGLDVEDLVTLDSQERDLA
ncbi:uncharacterized protein N7473_006333 [Penicillium subrubescens]|uniref:uncharacterized protein n=1 Tax=Penicillium subrubescens TaxID=1316194 RepID=UPI002545887F|nr:uncharacterized protein N7473_006333 [Penicillium subrubescens]KAJ5896934.1 hypothetical protein N7473_006333 [Penicillium subrubescens]